MKVSAASSIPTDFETHKSFSRKLVGLVTEDESLIFY
jgi:hypothetical protein